MELFRSAIRNRSWCKDPDEWLESLEIGNEAPLIAILLEVLTNVTTLKIYGFGSEEHLIFQAIERIRYNLKECEPNKITDLVFNSGHDSHDLVIIRQLLTLQSIHTIKIRNMVALTERNDEDRDRNVWDGQVRTFPNIHNIEFLRCDINPKVMYDFLEEYKNLRTFAYKKPRGDNLSFDPYWLCVTLLAHAKDSLIELTTVSPTDDDYYYPRMRYLHQFNKLQKLHITYEVLCGEHPESHHSISELIPRSIVELRLGFSRESFTGYVHLNKDSRSIAHVGA